MQSQRDHLTANNDYLVNLKSELINEDLHYKLDEMSKVQEERLKKLQALESKSKEL